MQGFCGGGAAAAPDWFRPFFLWTFAVASFVENNFEATVLCKQIVWGFLWVWLPIPCIHVLDDLLQLSFSASPAPGAFPRSAKRANRYFGAHRRYQRSPPLGGRVANGWERGGTAAHGRRRTDLEHLRDP